MKVGYTIEIWDQLSNYKITIKFTEAKAKNIKAVKTLLELNNAELSEDGTIKE